MERWAKAQNKRNESTTSKMCAPDPAGGPIGEGTAGSGAADAAFAVLLERRDRASISEKQNQVFQMHMKKDVTPVNNSLYFTLLIDLQITFKTRLFLLHSLILNSSIGVKCNEEIWISCCLWWRR